MRVCVCYGGLEGGGGGGSRDGRGLSQDMLQIMSSFVVALVLERETSGDVDVVVVVRCCHFLGNS